jgi:pimeloyl-ACP methyl ester carboxylesterase
MAPKLAVALIGFSQFRMGWIFRIIRGLIILAVVLALVLGGAAGYLTYRIVTDRNDIEDVGPASYLLSAYENVNFPDAAGGEHEGWLLLGLRGAPVIILCHGYNSNRSELLSLGQVLRENHFNVYLFNFRNAKAKEPASILGVRQVADVLAAIATLSKRHEVNPRRVGLFGTSTGGYAALVAATRSPLVKALVADTVYDTPKEMFDAEVDRRLGGSSPVFRFLVETDYHLLTPGTKAPSAREEIPKLGDIPKLFITGGDKPSLAAATKAIYNDAAQPKRLLQMEHSQTTLISGSEKKEYENQVLAFFLQNLPLRAD